jgi:ketosteroid isomerase-like protein
VAERSEKVRVAAEAYARGDLEAALQYLAPDTEFVLPRSIQPDDRVFHGPSGARAALRRLVGRYEGYGVSIDEIVEAPDGGVVVFGTQRGYDRELARHAEKRQSALITWRDERMARIEIYEDRAEGLRAAGIERGAP